MKRYTIICSAVLLLLMTGCSRQAATAHNASSFTVTNEVVDGEVRQVIVMTNGISLYVTKSWITVWFGDGYDEVVGFDPKTLKPHKILWDIPPSGTNPGQGVFDVNADGIPDIRQLKGTPKTRQIYYHGEWHTEKPDGAHTTIMIDGKEQRLYFDGQRWRKAPPDRDIVVTNALMSASF